MKTERHQTVNISELTKEQLRMLLVGELSWENAHEIAPGEDIFITEHEVEDEQSEPYAAEVFGYTPSGDDIFVAPGTPVVPAWAKADPDIPF